VLDQHPATPEGEAGPDFLDQLMAENEARSPGFTAQVHAALARMSAARWVAPKDDTEDTQDPDSGPLTDDPTQAE
jgi:hypothetical protein